MHSIWKGSVNFGLVNIPVRLYSAVASNAIPFHLLHEKDLSPVRFAKICKEEGREITYRDLVKGYEYDDGKYVVFEKEEFEKATTRKPNSVEIVHFVDEKQIDLIYCEQPYFLEPEKGAAKEYRLLGRALADSGKVAVCRFVMHQREHLGVLKPGKEGVILLNRMRFHEELKDPGELHIGAAKPTKRELDMALALIDQLTADFDPTQYHDEYRDELRRLVELKLKGKRLKPVSRAKKSPPVADLMAALRASLNKPKSGGKRKKAANVVPLKRAA